MEHSEFQKGRMCRLPDTTGDECFPKQFRETFGKHMDAITKAHFCSGKELHRRQCLDSALSSIINEKNHIQRLDRV